MDAVSRFLYSLVQPTPLQFSADSLLTQILRKPAFACVSHFGAGGRYAYGYAASTPVAPTKSSQLPGWLSRQFGNAKRVNHRMDLVSLSRFG